MSYLVELCMSGEKIFASEITLEVLGNLFSFDDFLPYRQFSGK